MRPLCSTIDFFYYLPNFSGFRNIVLALYAVFVTIFAENISQIGISLQISLAVIAFIVGFLPFLSKWLSQQVGHKLAEHIYEAIKQNKQTLLSLNRRVSNEEEIFNWLREKYPSSASKVVSRELSTLIIANS